jgi:succinoglycan biosynthesis transport protein ExoP
MSTEHPGSETLTIRDYLGVVRRRNLTLKSPPRYTAFATVLMGIGSPPEGANLRVAPDRLNETTAALARTPALARRVIARERAFDLSSVDFLAASTARSNPQHDVLTFGVTDGDRARAAALATAYASEFIASRRQLDGGVYVRETGEAHLVAPAERAVQTAPSQLKNIVLGFGLGLIAGILLAFLREALDTRVRSADELLARLGLPLLGRLPTLPRSRRRKPLVMLTEPDGPHAEPFRVLRGNLDFFNMEHGARSLMITSAAPGEGKSTTAANLAVALARTGRRVILADLDLRRGSLQRLLGLQSGDGVVDVLRGSADLDAALAPIDVSPPTPAWYSRGHAGDWWGALHVLPAGATPPSVGDFLTSHDLGGLIARLEERADIVLVDGPPLLGTGDGLTLAAAVDALAVVARVDEARGPALGELRRVLATCRAGKLGAIITRVPSKDTYYPTEMRGAAPVTAAERPSQEETVLARTLVDEP